MTYPMNVHTEFLAILRRYQTERTVFQSPG
jgi:hypothetical protein